MKFPKHEVGVSAGYYTPAGGIAIPPRLYARNVVSDTVTSTSSTVFFRVQAIRATYAPPSPTIETFKARRGLTSRQRVRDVIDLLDLHVRGVDFGKIVAGLRKGEDENDVVRAMAKRARGEVKA